MTAATSPIRAGDLVLLYAGNVKGLHIVLDVGPDAVAVTSAAELRIDGASFRAEMSAILAVWRADSANLAALLSRGHAIDLAPRPAPVAAVAAEVEAPDDPSVVILMLDPARKAVELMRMPRRGHGPARNIRYEVSDGRLLVDRRDVSAILNGVDGAKLGPGESAAGFNVPPAHYGF
jgi:hypothetical protein